MILLSLKFQLCGPTFTLETLLNSIIEVKPAVVAMGTHYFVQLSESDFFAKCDPSELDSVKLIAPTGAAVPLASVNKIMEKFRETEVKYR